MKTSRDRRKYSWVAGSLEGGSSREGLRLLPTSLGASESPLVASAGHECCKGSGTSGHTRWAEGLEHCNPWHSCDTNTAAAHGAAVTQGPVQPMAQLQHRHCCILWHSCNTNTAAAHGTAATQTPLQPMVWPQTHRHHCSSVQR